MIIIEVEDETFVRGIDIVLLTFFGGEVFCFLFYYRILILMLINWIILNSLVCKLPNVIVQIPSISQLLVKLYL